MRTKVMPENDTTVRIGYELRLNEYFGWVNELLPGASPVGAYCMGLAARLLDSPNKRIWPKRDLLLLQLRDCNTMRIGRDVIEDWLIVTRRTKGGAS